MVLKPCGGIDAAGRPAMESKATEEDGIEHGGYDSDDTLFGVSEPEQHGRDADRSDQPEPPISEHLNSARLDESPVGGLFPDGSQRPGENQEDEQHSQAAVDVFEGSHVLSIAGEALQHRYERPELDDRPADNEPENLYRHTDSVVAPRKRERSRALSPIQQRNGGENEDDNGRERDIRHHRDDQESGFETSNDGPEAGVRAGWSRVGRRLLGWRLRWPGGRLTTASMIRHGRGAMSASPL